MHFLSAAKKTVVAGCLLLLAGGTVGCMSKGGVLGTFGSAGAGEDIAVTNQVQNYGDISLPMEMKLVPEGTMALDTDSFKGGIHQYRGRVDLDSLRDYIIASMRNSKWKLAGEARYNYVMLAFTKPNKNCMVVLKPGALGYTIVNYYVTVDVAAANSLNPFGEPLQ